VEPADVIRAHAGERVDQHPLGPAGGILLVGILPADLDCHDPPAAAGLFPQEAFAAVADLERLHPVRAERYMVQQVRFLR
jgi:hypothetical protein